MKYNVVFIRDFNGEEIALQGVIDTDHISGIHTDYINSEYMNILLCGITHTIEYDESLVKFFNFNESSIT